MVRYFELIHNFMEVFGEIGCLLTGQKMWIRAQNCGALSIYIKCPEIQA